MHALPWSGIRHIIVEEGLQAPADRANPAAFINVSLDDLNIFVLQP